MEAIDVCSSEPNFEDATPNDVEQGYYCSRLVDHLKLRPLDVSTSSRLENEMQLAVASGAKGVHDVGSLLLYPLTKFGIMLESAMTSILPIIVVRKSQTLLVLLMKLCIWSLFCTRF
jgi:hypothetical protein